MQKSWKNIAGYKMGNVVSDKIKGVLVFIIAMLITLSGWSLARIIADIIDSNFIKVLYYIGLIGLWASCTIIAPIMIMNGTGVRPKDVGIGALSFFFILFSLIIGNNIIGFVLQAITGMSVAQFDASWISTLIWVFAVILYIVGLIAVPQITIYARVLKIVKEDE